MAIPVATSRSIFNGVNDEAVEHDRMDNARSVFSVPVPTLLGTSLGRESSILAHRLHDIGVGTKHLFLLKRFKRKAAERAIGAEQSNDELDRRATPNRSIRCS